MKVRALDEHVVSIETAVCGDNMQMGIEILEIAESMHRHRATGFRIGISDTGFQISTQHFPGTLGELGQRPAMKHEIYPKPFGDAKDPLPMGDMFEHFFT